MKKVLNFLRSMKFGIILLVFIAACSVLGSLITQGKSVAYYAQNYQSLHGVILMLNLNDVFNSWYFFVLVGLLCLNLILCSIVRVKGIVINGRDAVKKASWLPNTVQLSSEGVESLKQYLRNIHCKEISFGDTLVYSKNKLGNYGTFITHLSILLTVVFGAATLYIPQTIDQSCFPGESIVMDDGTEISVDSFRIENDDDDLDFTSVIKVSLADGRQSDWKSIKVNSPMSFGSYKIYQQTYGTAGSITVTNTENGGADNFTLVDNCFLSIDSINGLWYEALYPGYIKDPDGNITLITSTSGSYSDPVYQVLTASDGVYTPVLAFPGETITINELEFTFNDPVEYPGLRIKYTPTALNAMLIFSFALMIAGLFITFFMPPILVKVDSYGYIVTGLKPESMRIELKTLLKSYVMEEQT